MHVVSHRADRALEGGCPSNLNQDRVGGWFPQVDKLGRFGDQGFEWFSLKIWALRLKPRRLQGQTPLKYHDLCVVCVVCVVWLVLWCCGGVQDFRGCSPTPLPRTPRPHPRTPFRLTAQNFALFFTLPPQFSFIHLSLGGPYVEFWPKNSKRAHFRAPALQTPPNFNERSPKRERAKDRKCGGRGKKKKREILGPPPCDSPPFGAPLFPGLGQKWIGQNRSQPFLPPRSRP